MICGCETYECLDILIDPCNEGVNTGITATETGNYAFIVEFNGYYNAFSVSATSGNDINVPTDAFNENYTHIMSVTSPFGVVTCYKAKVVIAQGIPDAPFIPATSEFRLAYTVPETSSSITIEGLNTVTGILLPNGTLTMQQFTQVGDTITYTGNSFYEGDKIVLIF